MKLTLVLLDGFYLSFKTSQMVFARTILDRGRPLLQGPGVKGGDHKEIESGREVVRREIENVEDESETLKLCATIRGPAKGKPCIFPFKYKGSVHYECSADNELPWCATRVNKTGHFENAGDDWGYCSKNCPLPNVTDRCKHTEWKCQGTCISKHAPCHGECYGWMCNNSCINITEPCDHQCHSGYWYCYNTCIVKDQSCIDRCPPGRWNCDKKCISRNFTCYNTCHKSMTQCNGICIPKNETCEVCPDGMWGCYGECINKDKMCDDTCHQEMSKCRGICILKNATCKRCLDDMWGCNGECISETEPCNQNCAEEMWQCGDKCIYKNLPCGKQCQANHWNCNDDCILQNTTCENKCDNEFLKCSDEDKCISQWLYLCQTCPELTEVCDDYNYEWESSIYEDDLETENFCLYGSSWSADVCQNPSKYNISINCEMVDKVRCTGHRPMQCVSLNRRCNEILDCIDRSDESECPEKIIDYSVFQDCNGTDEDGNTYFGFRCDDMNCLDWNYWCNSDDERDMKFQGLGCVQLINSVFYDNICKNLTFWQNRQCNYGYNRCNGTMPGQCIDESNNEDLCYDELLIKDLDYCPQKDFFKCQSNNMCIHEILVCDGYIQCDDESDEDPNICQHCPRLGRYLAIDEKFATFSCKFIFTNRSICTIPCTGRASQCIDDENEKCQEKSLKVVIIVTILCLLVITFVSEFLRRQVVNEIKNVCGNINNIDSINLCDIIGSSKKIKRRQLSKFKIIHENDDFSVHITNFIRWVNLQDINKCQALKHNLIKFERHLHDNNLTNTNICLKQNLDLKRFNDFLSHIENKKGIQLIVQRMKHFAASSNFLMTLWLATTRLPVIILYLTDLVKDIYIIYLYQMYLPSKFDLTFFTYQVYIILLISVVLPSTLNLFHIANHCPNSNQMNICLQKLVLTISAPMISAISQLVIACLEYLKLQEDIRIMQLPCSKGSLLHEHRKAMAIESEIIKWNYFHSKLKSSEMWIENLIQSLLLIFFILIKYSKSFTFEGLHEFFAGEAILILVFSLVCSIVSLIIGRLKEITFMNGGVLSVKAQVIMGLFVLLSLFLRISSVVLYFTPALGLFDILDHWRMGSLETENYSQTFNEAWIPLADYTTLTHWSLQTYYIIFLLIFVAHFLVLYFLKIKNRQWENNFNMKKSFHLLSNIAIPTLEKDWNDGVTSEMDMNRNWFLVSMEMKAMLKLFAVEHIMMCFPMFVLAANIWKRNEFLNEYFPQVAEEKRATCLTYSLCIVCPIAYAAMPFLQYRLFKIYNMYCHPWSDVLNPQNGRKNSSRFFPTRKTLFGKVSKEKVFRQFWSNIEKWKNLEPKSPENYIQGEDIELVAF